MKYQINISGLVIEVERKKIKNLRLMVYPPDGRVKVSAPLPMNEETIRIFLISKSAWIQKHRLKYAGRKLPAPQQFVTGETHYYLGSPYTLRIEKHNKYSKVELCGNDIVLYIKPGSTKIQRAKTIENWYRAQLKATAPELISKWEKVAGVSINDFGIKKMKTRWGSCNIRTKRIWLNLELIRKPIICLEFIILHELVHLLERNHNAVFKSYMDKFMPQWREHNRELKHFPFNSKQIN